MIVMGGDTSSPALCGDFLLGLCASIRLSHVTFPYYVTKQTSRQITDPTSKFHAYAILIQDVKDLIEQSNIIVCHTLREGN